MGRTVPHLLLIGARAEIVGKLVGLPLAVTVVTRPGSDGAFERSVALRTATADVTDTDELVGCVKEIHAQRPVDAVMGLTELALLPASLAGEALGVRTNPSAAVALTRDKAAMRARLADRGVDTTAHRICADVEELRDFAAGCPTGVVVKPVRGNGGIGIALARRPEELADAWQFTADAVGADAVLAEEYLLGREVSVETVSAAGEHRVLAVTTKHTTGPPRFVETGHELPAALPAGAGVTVAGAVTDALDALGHRWGPCHTEVIVQADRVAVVELNTRFGGARIWEMVEMATGVDMASVACVAVAFGRLPAALPIDRPSPGAAAIRFLTAAPGRIAALDGVDAALGVDGVVRVGDLKDVGDVLGPLVDYRDRVGYVLAAGPDLAAAVAAAERAAGLIRVRMVSP